MRDWWSAPLAADIDDDDHIIARGFNVAAVGHTYHWPLVTRLGRIACEEDR